MANLQDGISDKKLSLIFAQLCCDSCQYLHDLQFRFRILLQSLCRDLAQVFESGAHERWGRLSALLFLAEAAAQMIRLAADACEPVEDRIDEGPILFQIAAAFIRDGIELLRAVCLRRQMSRLFELGKRGIHDARAWRIPARRALFEWRDDVVAMARLLGDERQRKQPQIALREHASRADEVAHAAPAAPSETASAAAATARAIAMVRPVISHSTYRV